MNPFKWGVFEWLLCAFVMFSFIAIGSALLAFLVWHGVVK